MARTRIGVRMAALLLAVFVAAPLPAAAIQFIPIWGLNGWTFGRTLGNVDGDLRDELMFTNNADGHLAVVDGATGVIEKDLPEFRASDSYVTAENLDADPRLELLCVRPGSGAITPLTRVYDWTPGGYVQLLSHTDPITGVSVSHFRSASQCELFEMAPTDVRLRDLNGTVLLSGSAAVSPWTGVDVARYGMELDGDPIAEVGLIQHWNQNDQQTLFFDYVGGAFVYRWAASGWNLGGSANLDGDAAGEVFGFNWLDGRYAFLSGVDGSSELELPEFTFDDDSNVFPFDIDGDGRSEVFALRPKSLTVTPLVRAYKWVAGTYVQMFSHTEDFGRADLLQTRSLTQWEFLENSKTDVVLRDMAGTVLFRASTAFPGWSGTDVVAYAVNLDTDNVAEIVMWDHTTWHVVRYNAGSYTQLWSTSTWNLSSLIPGAAGGSPLGFVVTSVADNHYGMINPILGNANGNFPDFTPSNSYLLPVDFDHNGTYELVFQRVNSPYLSTCYRRAGPGYIQLYSHTDPTPNSVEPGSFRTSTSSDLLELTSNDLRVRTSTGAVIYRASTELPGWSGTDATKQVLDVEHDGIDEFLAIDDGGVRLMRYIGTLDVDGAPEGGALKLVGASPNPFRASTVLQFATRREGDVGIAIFDVGGRLVRRLDRRLSAGRHEVAWDGRDEQGRVAPSGVLFYEVRSDGVRQTRKLVRLPE
ncbi:MAG: hypothetical protein IPJ04_11770 [Candidatus Eisenbacteria bacterium]|nr:hypothetical protein [Candidatus Eisenbacteria bacterium]